MSSGSKVEVEAGELALLLYESLVVKRAVNLPSKLKIPRPLETKMRAKITLYQFASVSLAITNEQKTDFAFRFVEQQLSRLNPPETALFSATTSLRRILGTHEAVGYMNWASEWLIEIGVNESNPAVLGMFTYGWVQHYLLVVETLKGVALRATS
jgi:hypothetical protein